MDAAQQQALPYTRSQLLGRQALPLQPAGDVVTLAPGQHPYFWSSSHQQVSNVAVKVQVRAQWAAASSVGAGAHRQARRASPKALYPARSLGAQRHYGDEGVVDTSRYDAAQVRARAAAHRLCKSSRCCAARARTSLATAGLLSLSRARARGEQYDESSKQAAREARLAWIQQVQAQVQERAARTARRLKQQQLQAQAQVSWFWAAAKPLTGLWGHHVREQRVAERCPARRS